VLAGGESQCGDSTTIAPELRDAAHTGRFRANRYRSRALRLYSGMPHQTARNEDHSMLNIPTGVTSDSRRSRRPWKRPGGRAILSGMADQAPPPYEFVNRASGSSMESFASPQQAHTDGRQMIERLTQVSRLGR
jgi:hypothetical protein